MTLFLKGVPCFATFSFPPLCLSLSGPLPARDRVWGLLRKAGPRAQVVIPHRSRGSRSPTASCSHHSAPSNLPFLLLPSVVTSIYPSRPRLMCPSGGICRTVRCSARCEDATRCPSNSTLATHLKDDEATRAGARLFETNSAK